MTVTFILNTGKSVSVPDVNTSDLVNDLIIYTGLEDVTITVPKQYDTLVLNVFILTFCMIMIQTTLMLKLYFNVSILRLLCLTVNFLST